MSDEPLLESIARGDSRAFEQLYLSYRPRLARFVSRLAPGCQSVDEMINDTFMAVWQHARRFRNASKVSTWIFGIAYRVAMKSLRQDKRWANFEHGQPELVTDPAAEIEDCNWLAQGLDRLSRDHRTTLLLVHYWGHSIADVAATTQSRRGTVKARLFRAREKLRLHLAELPV